MSGTPLVAHQEALSGRSRVTFVPSRRAGARGYHPPVAELMTRYPTWGFPRDQGGIATADE